MNLEELKQLAKEWVENPACHDKFRRDPIAYLKLRGYQVDELTRVKLENLNALSDDEIENRINKGQC